MKRTRSVRSPFVRIPFVCTAIVLVALLVASACTSEGPQEIVTGSPQSPSIDGADAANGEGTKDLPATDASLEEDRDLAVDESAPDPDNGVTESIAPESTPMPPGSPGTEPVMEEPVSDLDEEDVDVPPADVPDAIEEVSAPPAELGEFRRVPARKDLLSVQRGHILEVTMADESTVLVRFESAPEGCGGADVLVTETDTEVRLELLKGLPPEAMSRGCPAVIELHEIAVPLAAPMTGRVLTWESIDGTGAPAPESSLEDYIGLPLEAAIELADASSRRSRAVWIDGEGMMVTEDFVPSRLNFTVVNDIVVGLKTDAGETAGDPR